MNTAGHRRTRKRRVFWSLAALLVIGALGVAALLVYRHLKARGWAAAHRVIAWQADAYELSADEAKAQWELIGERTESDLRWIGREWQASPYAFLGNQYSAEGRDAEAFEMYERARIILGNEPGGLEIYAAGLARRTDWLQTVIDRDPARRRFRAAFARACLASAKRDYVRVLKLTARNSPEKPSGSGMIKTGERAWLSIVRAEALLRLGHAAEAYDELVVNALPAGSDFGEVSNDYFRTYLVLLITRAAEEAGRLEDALVYTERTIRWQGVMNYPSWRRIREEFLRRQERLTRKLSPERDGL